MPKTPRALGSGICLSALVFLTAALAPAVRAQDAPRSLEVLLRLSTPGAPAAIFAAARPSVHLLAVRGLRIAPEPPNRERPGELSEDLLVVSARDGDGKEICRVAIVDPRLLRAEVADEQGRMSSARLYRPEAEFTVALPDLAGIASLRIFQPVWNGVVFDLEPIGEVPIGERR